MNRDALHQALRAAMRVGRATAAAWLSPVFVRDELRWTPAVCAGPSVIRRRLAELAGQRASTWLPVSAWPRRGRFELCLDEPASAALRERLLGPNPSGGDALAADPVVLGRTVVVDGWVSGVLLLVVASRDSAPARRALRRRGDLLTPFRAMVRKEPLLARPAALVADEHGRGRLADAGARAWLDAQGAGGVLAIPGHGLHVLHDALVFAVPGGGRDTTLELHPHRRPRLGRVLDLTRCQRRVAILAAEGVTIPELAQVTGTRPETARSHLKRAYDVLGITRRSQLPASVASSQG